MTSFFTRTGRHTAIVRLTTQPSTLTLTHLYEYFSVDRSFIHCSAETSPCTWNTKRTSSTDLPFLPFLPSDVFENHPNQKGRGCNTVQCPNVHPPWRSVRHTILE